MTGSNTIDAERARREIIELARDVIFTRFNIPNDEDKSDADWDKDALASAWRQQAFNSYWTLAREYLDVRLGDKQTSRDTHMFCQGFALAMEYLPRFIENRSHYNAIATGSGTAKTPKAVECEASQSGAKRIAQPQGDIS